ncbi:MAG: T9SS type A sorting domain-containing protein, partial [Bacteroidia bacterium]|nr:T9SS type A sorting domain-containing protein [Bacteroidia bacterium]
AAITAYSQSGKQKPVGGQLVNMKEIAKEKFGENGQSGISSVNPIAPSDEVTSSGEKSAINNTWGNITSSMNIYGVSISFTKPLQWNDDLNAVSFIHRKSPTYAMSPTPASQAETGGVVAMISADCGGTWDSTALYGDDNFWGRYPGGAIYNPPSTPTNTDISQAYVVGAGPTTGAATGWIGNWYSSKQLGVINYDNQIPSSAQFFPTLGPYPAGMSRHDFAAYNFTGTDDGVMRVLAGVTNDATTSDTAVALVKGVFNGTSFDWTDTVFNPPTVMASDNTEQWLSRPMMAWNESGTVGYLVIIGARTGAIGSNVGFQPIVYKTTNSGGSWTLDPNGIDFNSPAFADVLRPIITVNEDSTLEVPFFMWTEGMDVAVDANNKLHIFSTVVGTASNHPDSLAFITSFTTERYRWPHKPGFRPYLYDFIYDGTNWSHITVDSMPTEGAGQLTTEAGYADNPWDPDPSNSNQKIRLSARLQLSRTPDGKYIVYNWTESDTTLVTNYRKWNIYPNVHARVYNSTTGTIHSLDMNVTNTPSTPNSVKNRAMFMHTSPKCRLSSTVTANGPVISIPITVSNSSPYSQLSKNNHWFSWATLNFGNVPDGDIVVCGAAPTPTTPTDTSGLGVAESAYNSAMSSYVFPNPAKNNATVKVNLVNSSKIQIQLMNAVGQVISTTSMQGQAGVNSISLNISGVSSGIYFVSVKVDEAVGTKKLVIE